MVSSISRVRILVATTRELAPFLTENEINDIGKVLLGATERMTKESEDKDGQANGE